MSQERKIQTQKAIKPLKNQNNATSQDEESVCVKEQGKPTHPQVIDNCWPNRVFAGVGIRGVVLLLSLVEHFFQVPTPCTSEGRCTVVLTCLFSALQTGKEPFQEAYNMKPSRCTNSASHKPGKTQLPKLITLREFIQKNNSPLTLEKRELRWIKDGRKHCSCSA